MARPAHRLVDRTARVLALLTLCLAITACASFDRHKYYSSVDLPLTVAVRDSFTKEALWQMDVPVHHTLKLDFDRAGEIEAMKVSGKPATSLRWEVSGPTYNKNGSAPLPGTPIYIDQKHRPAPEYPPAKD